MHRNAKKSKDGPSRSPKSINARRLRGIFFIEPDDEEFKRVMKNARRKLEIPMPAAMPCRLPLKSSTGKLAAKLDNTRRNILVLLRPTNL